MTAPALYQWVRDAIQARPGAVFDVQPLHLNLLGVRGLWHGQRVPNAADEYNDTIFACWLNALGEQCADSFEASCDPGKLSQAFVNPRGVAHLTEGQWWFRRGEHRGVRALVQARPVTVARYTTGDGAGALLDTGFFGVNLHAGGTGMRVGNWSAGCQVVCGWWTGDAWHRLDALLYAQADPEQAEIPYTLISSTAVPPPP